MDFKYNEHLGCVLKCRKCEKEVTVIEDGEKYIIYDPCCFKDYTTKSIGITKKPLLEQIAKLTNKNTIKQEEDFVNKYFMV